MKKLLISFITLLFIFCGCVKEVIECNITTPENYATFLKYESIRVDVEASTTKGSIIQVVLLVDDKVIDSLREEPYNFTIPPDTISAGEHILYAAAYNSQQNREVAMIHITIK